MNKKTKTSLLALTLLASVQIHPSDKNNQRRRPVYTKGKNHHQDAASKNSSIFTLKNAGIAAGAALATGAALGAYYYRDAIGDAFVELANNWSASDPATRKALISQDIEQKNAEISAQLHDVASKEQAVAAEQQFLALSENDQAQILQEIAQATPADVNVRLDGTPEVVAEIIPAEINTPVVDDVPIVQATLVDNSARMAKRMPSPEGTSFDNAMLPVDVLPVATAVPTNETIAVIPVEQPADDASQTPTA